MGSVAVKMLAMGDTERTNSVTQTFKYHGRDLKPVHIHHLAAHRQDLINQARTKSPLSVESNPEGPR